MASKATQSLFARFVELAASQLAQFSSVDRANLEQVLATISPLITFDKPNLTLVTGDSSYSLRLNKTLGTHAAQNAFSTVRATLVKQILEANKAVKAVKFHLNHNSMHVEMALGKPRPDTKVRYTPPAARKTFHSDINWKKMEITDADDQSLIQEIADYVYHIDDVIPDIRFWVEYIGQDGAVARANRGEGAMTDTIIPGTEEMGDGTASETSEGGIIPESQRVGYAMCFEGLPNFNGDFLRYVMQRVPKRLIDLYLWFTPPKSVSRRPLLVALIQKASEAPSDVNFYPRGLTKRARFA